MAALFRYEGKRVLITGAYSGMGAATAKLLADAGAEIYALDIKDVRGAARFIPTDMGDPAAIDAAVQQIGSPIDALFNCAGIPPTFPALEVMKVNLLGLRHLTERVLPLMPAGAAVAHIASIRSIGWQERLGVIKELLATPDFDSGLRWCESHPDQVENGYGFSKQCVAVYTMMRARTSVQKGVRMNCVSPGIIDTPMLPAFRQSTGNKVIDWTLTQGNGRAGQAHEIAPALIFLNSAEASYVNGHNLVVDGGFSSAMATGIVDYSGFAG